MSVDTVGELSYRAVVSLRLAMKLKWPARHQRYWCEAEDEPGDTSLDSIVFLVKDYAHERIARLNMNTSMSTSVVGKFTCLLLLVP